jgi:hypothetical protein
MSTTLPQTILEHAHALPEGGVLAPKDFLHLGSRAAIDQAFSRLAKQGLLLRVARGSYTAPVKSRFGSRAPASEKLVQSMAQRSGVIVVPHGAAAANALGLTQQVPIREAYVTPGRSHRLQVGKAEIVVRHGPSWMFALGAGVAGAAVRALAWVGPDHVRPSLAKLRRTLPATDWQALIANRAALPSWMAQAIGEEAARI